MGTMASQITSFTNDYSSVYSGADQRKHQSSASLAFVRGIHQLHEWLLKLLFRCRSKKTSKLCVTGLCEGNSPVIGEFPSQRASNAENVSIWWRHQEHTISQVQWMVWCMSNHAYSISCQILIHNPYTESFRGLYGTLSDNQKSNHIPG